MNKTDQKYLDSLRHSCAHLLAAAVLELYPDAKLAIGPSIENGFYYDIDFGDTKVSDTDLSKIEKMMKKLIGTWMSFDKEMLDAKKAKSEYGGSNEYKNELIDDFSEKGKKEIGFYKSTGSKSKAFGGREYWDLCRGGHVDSPSKEIKYFKLLKIAGAYWRGDEKNNMLTRIYGTCWPTQKELIDYVEMLEEAKKRDHKKLGPQLGLFMFHETSPGMPYWLPNGLILYNELINYWRIEHKNYDYQEIMSPLINKSDLYVTSGHWEYYKDDMFVADMGENEVYGLKPMNCPNAMVVFGSSTRSYKDLPFRLSDIDRLHRYERSGTLNGLFRVRSFQQDDAHNYITEDMIETEYSHIFDVCEKFYSIFGLKYSFNLGTRPEKYLGKKETWDKAEVKLKKVLEKSGVEFEINEGDGAFYGPKVDIFMKDSVGRQWQMGTIQLDYQLPSRFKLKYIDKDGTEKTPVVVHRVIYGSLERFIGILIEHFAGAFPVWISPLQVKVLPITDRNLKYAEKVQRELVTQNIRSEVDERSETLQAKIRDAQIEKVPYMVIIGDREESQEKVAIRLRDGKDLGQISTNDFASRVQNIIDTKSLEL